MKVVNPIDIQNEWKERKEMSDVGEKDEDEDDDEARGDVCLVSFAFRGPSLGA